MILSRPKFATPQPAKLARWLFIVAVLVLLIVVVGGITRLTESGLSITEWKPVTGTIPPLSEAAWQAEFLKYQQIPEYQQINNGMTLEAFKNIFFWEYIHRLLGRLIGLAMALPLMFYWWKRAIPTGYALRLTAILSLIGLQGAVGWWMVSSGLAIRTDVSHVRLAVHLLLALTILGGLIWTALDLRQLAKNPNARPARLSMFTGLVLVTLFVQLLLGAFTAGLNAGYAFSSWPKMGAEWFPSATPMITPFWHNLVDNPIVVQFTHRWFAWLAAAMIVILAVKVRKNGHKIVAGHLIMFTALQIILGIATLLSGVNIVIGVAHQAMGALLVLTTVMACHIHGTKLEHIPNR